MAKRPNRSTVEEDINTTARRGIGVHGALPGTISLIGDTRGESSSDTNIE